MIGSFMDLIKKPEAMPRVFLYFSDNYSLEYFPLLGRG